MDCKSGQFSVGFSTDDFTGTKKIGETKESIGISGDGKVHFNDDSGQTKSVSVNPGGGNFDLIHGFVFGVGYVFKTRKVLFTVNGKEIDCRDLP